MKGLCSKVRCRNCVEADVLCSDLGVCRVLQADNYELDFDASLSPTQRTLAFAAVFLIDFMWVTVVKLELFIQ